MTKLIASEFSGSFIPDLVQCRLLIHKLFSAEASKLVPLTSRDFKVLKLSKLAFI